MKTRKLSIIIPSYNEELNILNVHKALTEVMEQTNYDYELIYVDNASEDNSYQIFKKLAQQDKHTKIIRYSRNFGYQMALKGGLDYASGDGVIFIDGDLQDPPSLILEFIEKWEEGFDVIYGVRKKRKGNKLRRAFYKIFYRLINKLSDIQLPVDAGEFGLIDKKIAEILKNLPEVNLYLRGLRAWCGFKQVGIEYLRDDRELGTTKFNFYRNLKLAFDGITGFSTKPLELIFHTGIFCIFLSLVLMIYSFFIKFFSTQTGISGWASLLIAVVFFGGVQLFSIGVLGEYIGRLFTEVKDRPKYIVSEIMKSE